MLYKTLLILAVIVLLVSYVVYRIAFYSPNKTQNDDYHISRSEQMDAQRETITEMIDTLNAIPYEPVVIPADDGLRLRGRYYHQKDGAPVVIGFHGYRGTPSRDFAGGTELYLSSGFNLLMVEQHTFPDAGHGLSFLIDRERYERIAHTFFDRVLRAADVPM